MTAPQIVRRSVVHLDVVPHAVALLARLRREGHVRAFGDYAGRALAAVWFEAWGGHVRHVEVQLGDLVKARMQGRPRPRDFALRGKRRAPTKAVTS